MELGLFTRPQMDPIALKETSAREQKKLRLKINKTFHMWGKYEFCQISKKY